MLRNDTFDVICGLYPATVLIFSLEAPVCGDIFSVHDGLAPLLFTSSCQTAKKP